MNLINSNDVTFGQLQQLKELKTPLIKKILVTLGGIFSSLFLTKANGSTATDDKFWTEARKTQELNKYAQSGICARWEAEKLVEANIPYEEAEQYVKFGFGNYDIDKYNEKNFEYKRAGLSADWIIKLRQYPIAFDLLNVTSYSTRGRHYWRYSLQKVLDICEAKASDDIKKELATAMSSRYDTYCDWPNYIYRPTFSFKSIMHVLDDICPKIQRNKQKHIYPYLSQERELSDEELIGLCNHTENVKRAIKELNLQDSRSKKYFYTVQEVINMQDAKRI